MHLLFRILGLFVAVAALPAFAGALAAGWKGALVGALAGTLGLVRSFYRSELWIARLLSAGEIASPHLERTFSESLNEIDPDSRLRRPCLRVYPDPVTNVLAVRSLGGPGTIFLSQGALHQLDEAGLREALRISMLRLQREDWKFKSACAAIASGLVARAPRGWMAFLFAKSAPAGREDSGKSLGVGALLASVALFPWIRFLLGINPPLAADSPGSGALQRARIHHPRNGLPERVALDALFLIPSSSGDRITGVTVSS